MSKVSEISRQYHDTLAHSRTQYEQMYQDRAGSTEHFYRKFFNRLVCPFAEKFANERFRARLQERIERAIGTDTLQFLAIDGTCRREVFADFVTFFGGAYGARGEVTLTAATHLDPGDNVVKFF